MLAQPRRRPLRHPPTGKNRESSLPLPTPRDLQRAARSLFHPVRQFPRVSSVRPYQIKPRKLPDQLLYHKLRAVPILDIRRMNRHLKRQPPRVHDDVSLAPVHLFARVIPAIPPDSVVCALWLSMIAAPGSGFRPSARRTSARSASWMRFSVPSRFHFRK